MKNKILTAKQERFAQLVASGSKYSDAYYATHDVSPDTPSKSVWEQASHLVADVKVASRIQELKAVDEAALATRRGWDLDRLTEVFEVNLEGARRDKQWGSANGAGVEIGRVTGLVSDKVQPGSVAVTKIIINLAPGVEPPPDRPVSVTPGGFSEEVEATEHHEVEDEAGDT